MNILYIVKGLSVVEPTGVMQISAITKSLGHRSILGVIEEDDLLATIKKEKVDLVALSMLSTEVRAFRQQADAIRNKFPYLPIIAGGPHPTYFPDMIKTWPLDGVIIGEGDSVMKPLLENLEAGKDLSDVPNVITRTGKGNQLPLVENLDELPFFDRELVHHRAPFAFTPLKSFMATRGCPYACSYCFNNAYRHLYSGLGKMVRRRSVESLITEIEEVHSRYPMNFVRFGDDVFVIKDDEWLDEFVESYRSRIRLPFYCLIRPNLVTDSIVTKLKAAGCHSVSISLESGSAKLRKTILNRSIDDATIIEAYDTLNRHGINTFSNAMLGLPGATIEDDLSSLEMSFRLKPIYSSFTVFTPFPGTDLYRLCVERGDIDENFDEESFPESTFSSSLLRQSTDLDHRIHKNIMMLGALAVSCPAIRNLIMKHLLYWRPNILFSVIGFVVRNYRQRKIWPVRVGILGFMRLVWRVLKLDLMNYRR